MPPVKKKTISNEYLTGPASAIPVTRNQTALLRKYEIWREAFQQKNDLLEACKGMIFMTSNPIILTRNRCNFIKCFVPVDEPEPLKESPNETDKINRTEPESSKSVTELPVEMSTIEETEELTEELADANPNESKLDESIKSDCGDDKLKIEHPRAVNFTGQLLPPTKLDSLQKKKQVCKASVAKMRRHSFIGKINRKRGKYSVSAFRYKQVSRPKFSSMLLDKFFTYVCILMYPLVLVLEIGVRGITKISQKTKDYI